MGTSDPMQGIFHGFDIAGAGLRAEMQRSEVVAANLSNMHLVGGKGRDPYRRRSVIFEEALAAAQGSLHGVRGAAELAAGVRVKEVVEDRVTPFIEMHDPGHPLADERGIVKLSNVDMVREMVDMSIIERSFQANLSAMRAYRTMVQDALANLRS